MDSITITWHTKHSTVTIACCRTTISSSTLRCTWGRSCPRCVVATTSPSGPTTSLSKWVWWIYRRCLKHGISHARLLSFSIISFKLSTISIGQTATAAQATMTFEDGSRYTGLPAAIVTSSLKIFLTQTFPLCGATCYILSSRAMYQLFNNMN